ncbi:MAG: sigma-70 family RNA polymerase sigma factor [Verrucomicrobiota bacterium]
MMNPSSNDDAYREFVGLFTQNEGGLRAFVRTLLPSWDDANEVMQEVSLVAWKKFDQFDRETEFIRWAATIARFEVLNYRRTKARDRLVFDEEVIQLLAEEVEEEMADQDAQRRALEGCLAKLPEQRRQLVLRAHSPGQKMKPMAEEVGVSPNALYKTIERIRLSLYRCIEDTLNQQPSS